MIARPAIPRRLLALVAVFATISALAPAAPAQEQDRDVNEAGRAEAEITVFEAQVTADTSDLGVVDRQRLRPENVLLLEGGVPRRVTNIEPLGSSGWRVLIYVDVPTSRARTVKLATQRLGSLAQELTNLGRVEVVLADPEPRTVLELDREATPLAGRLAEIASSGAGGDEIKKLRDAFAELEPSLSPADPRRAEALRREVELVRGRVDRLLLRVAAGCEGEPCALLLVTDGFYLEPAAFYLGEHRLAGIGETQPLDQAAQELAETVAGYEWLAFSLPVRENRDESPVVAKPRSDFDEFLDHTGAVKRIPKASDREPTIDWEKLEVSVTPILQPLVRLAAGSGGGVVRAADDIGLPLERLPSRRRLYYLTDRQLDGQPRPVSARMLQSGATIGTPAWIRSSTPPAVSAARVRAVLAGRKPEQAAALTAKIERDAAGQATLVLETTWASAPLPQSLVRVSVGFAREGDLPWVGHQRVRAGAIAEGATWQHRLTLPQAPASGPIAVVAEALGPRTWAAALVETAQ
jgi:hypothetical protein